MSLPKFLTPQELLANPSIMTMNGEDNFIAHAYDGLVGAVINDGCSFVTSPNIDYIPFPPLGGDRDVYRRMDLRYGPDDPLHWPQLYVSKMPHLAAIPSRITDPKNPLSIMWMDLTRQDFSVSRNAILGGGGCLHPELYNDFRAQIVAIKRLALKERDGKVFPPCAYLADLLDTILFRLGRVATTFQLVRLNVSALQRVFLELRGMVDYLDCYQPRMNGLADAGDIPIAKTIGTFTTDASQCEMFFKARLPVWFVRPYTELHNARVAKVVELVPPEATMASEPSHGARVIINTKSSNPLKYNAIMKDTLSCMCYPDVFNSLRAAPDPNRPSTAQPSTSRINRQERAARYSPYSRRNKSKPFTNPLQPAAGRNKFDEPSASFFPPPIPVWLTALQRVNRDPSNFLRPDVNPTGVGYLFPEPASFTSLQDSARRKTFFRTWLKYRPALLYRVGDPTASPEPQNNYFWQQLLSVREPDPQNNTKSNTKAGTIQALVRRFLEGCQADAAETVETSEEITWDEKPFEQLGDDEYEEILWELTELNFRFELLALDALLSSGATGFDRQQMVEDCFFGHSGSLMVVQLSTSNRGLGDEDWEARAPFYLALRKLMVSWAGSPFPPVEERVRWRRDELEVLEQKLADFYTQSFFNYFHRAPIVPRRLSHSVPRPPLEVSPSEPYMLNPKPNIYYNLSVLNLQPNVDKS